LQAPAATVSRASIAVAVRVRSDAGALDVAAKSVALVGPGDIIGVNTQMVVRTEPRAGVTNFESNFLAYVDFYDEDFAWRYTPDIPDTGRHRLTPWITLTVLKDDEFDPLVRRPLPAIELTAAANLASIFPPPDQLWAWAHVHVNAALGNGAPNLHTLGLLLRQNPDLGYCRLMSPRHLEPNTGYHAFVIPTFEVGRLAGLGQAPPDNTPGLTVSWATGRTFPVYYSWWFRTGTEGDFEQLVRALVPHDIDSRVGVRLMDVQQPGFQLPPTTGQSGNVVGLEGVLLAPTTQHVPVAPGCSLPRDLANEVNLPADAQDTGVGAGPQDPLISAPLYGRWHALVERGQPFTEHRNWINDLNTDPRFRTMAGMGTKVIQQNQEDYMKLAWEQIGDVLSVNRKIVFLQMAVKASEALYTRNLITLPAEQALALTAPAMRKVMGSPVTVHALVQQSRLPRAALSGAMRKQLRMRGQLARRTFGGAQPVLETVNRLNAGTITAAPPRPAPDGSTYQSTLSAVTPHIPAWLAWVSKHRTLLLAIALIVLFILLMLGPPVSKLLALLGIVVAGVIYRLLTQLAKKVDTANSFAPEALTPEAVSSLPPNDAFVMPAPGAPVVALTPHGDPDSPQGVAFRQAAIRFNTLFTDRPEPPVARQALELVSIHTAMLQALRPAPAFTARYSSSLSVGKRPFTNYIAGYLDAVAAASADPRIVPVMAYPDIKLPMYRPLKDLQKDNFVPNLYLVPPNTISLMLTNPPVIEAYMVGLNHEFARELLWREYPTDQRPSTFRQFWDPSNFADTEGLSPEAFAEKVRDIRRIHEWSLESVLGTHNNRLFADDRPRIVLIIRGDLLKRYPNTVIYAQKARWGDPPDHMNDLTLYDETGAKAEADPGDPNFRFPIFKAQVEPDVYFVGFDLLLDEARGDPSLTETPEGRARTDPDRLGWFFVLQQVVGEPRFGLDEHAVTTSEDPVKWDNLSWENLGVAVALIDLSKPFASQPPGTQDGGATWGSNAGDMAFILYQKPVLVGIHARDMLKNLTAPA
jgi:hypothetical protein